MTILSFLSLLLLVLPLRFPLWAAGGAAGLLMLKELATTAAENCAARGRGALASSILSSATKRGGVRHRHAIVVLCEYQDIFLRWGGGWKGFAPTPSFSPK